jgi:hypothetical protein
MRDIFFVTKEPMSLEYCFEAISKVYKSADTGIGVICLDRPAPKSAYMWFPSLKKYEPGEVWEEDDLKDVPDDYNYFTNLEYHLSCVSKNFVRALRPLYPDMLIQDGDSKVYTIEEYLNCKFDH